MTLFASALKRGTGVDLFRRPFWRNHAHWRRWCLPPYAEWMGFGDHSERWVGTWRSNADLVDLSGRETGSGAFAEYAAGCRSEADAMPMPAERLVYFRGTADASYADRAARCRRHVAFLKSHVCFLLVEEFVAAPDVVSAMQWNMHSWNQFAVDEKRRTFVLERGASSLEGHILYRRNGFFSLSDGWDPPPLRGKDDSQWHQQYHLRFTPSGLVGHRNLGVALCPGHRHRERTDVRCELAGTGEAVRLGEDVALVGQGEPVTWEGVACDGLLALRLDGRLYQIADDGIATS